MNAPHGAVAIWHDIAPEGLAEFYAWHGREHMPERLAIPGFRRGRRFRAVEADLAFFNLYETETVAVLTSAEYRARLAAPTPWTLATVKHFRAVARALCRVAIDIGAAEGGIVATLRYDLNAPAADRHLAHLRDETLPALAGRPGIARCRLLAADRAASGEINAEQRARGTANAVPGFVLVVEGWAGERAFLETVRAALAPAQRAALGIPDSAPLGFYRLEIALGAG